MMNRDLHSNALVSTDVEARDKYRAEKKTIKDIETLFSELKTANKRLDQLFTLLEAKEK